VTMYEGIFFIGGETRSLQLLGLIIGMVVWLMWGLDNGDYRGTVGNEGI